MATLLGFSPYVVFFVLMRVVSVEAGLAVAALLAVYLAWRGWRRTGTAKVLEVGAAVLFVALAVFTAVRHQDWSLTAVRLAVDLGLLAIILVSLAIGEPFTVQYARERVPEAHWHSPLFLAVNRRITWAWAAAFAALVAAHVAVVLVPGVPVMLDAVVTVAAFGGAAWFTVWYPKRVRKTAVVTGATAP